MRMDVETVRHTFSFSNVLVAVRLGNTNVMDEKIGVENDSLMRVER